MGFWGVSHGGVEGTEVVALGLGGLSQGGLWRVWGGVF